MFGIAQKSLLVCLSLAVLCVAGCQVVNVKDRLGNPIRWANVSTSSRASGTGSFPVKTDLFGNATLMISQEPPGTLEWLTVTKTGYRTSRIVRPEDPTVDVILIKSPSSSLDAKEKK